MKKHQHEEHRYLAWPGTWNREISCRASLQSEGVSPHQVLHNTLCKSVSRQLQRCAILCCAPVLEVQVVGGCLQVDRGEGQRLLEVGGVPHPHSAAVKRGQQPPAAAGHDGTGTQWGSTSALSLRSMRHHLGLAHGCSSVLGWALPHAHRQHCTQACAGIVLVGRGTQ